MTVDLRETRLPGIGVKFTFRTAEGARVSVIQHNDGDRELYFFGRAADDEPAAVLGLRDDEARQLGAVLGGAYERPKVVEDLELALGQLQIEWVKVPEDSPALGRSIADCGFRSRTGVTVIAILREPEPIAGAQPEHVVEAGDTLVVVGKAGQVGAFRRLLGEGPFEGGYTRQ